MNQKEPIEYESVTVKLPKPLLAVQRFLAGQDNQTIEEKLEYDLVDSIRAELEGMNGEDLIACLGIGPIFYQLLDDKRYKPADATEPIPEPVIA